MRAPCFNPLSPFLLRGLLSLGLSCFASKHCWAQESDPVLTQLPFCGHSFPSPLTLIHGPGQQDAYFSLSTQELQPLILKRGRGWGL